MKPHPNAKIRNDEDGFFSQECSRCKIIKWEELFWSESDGKGGWQLKSICAACELEIHCPPVLESNQTKG